MQLKLLTFELCILIFAHGLAQNANHETSTIKYDEKEVDTDIEIILQVTKELLKEWETIEESVKEAALDNFFQISVHKKIKDLATKKTNCLLKLKQLANKASSSLINQVMKNVVVCENCFVDAKEQIRAIDDSLHESINATKEECLKDWKNCKIPVFFNRTEELSAHTLLKKVQLIKSARDSEYFSIETEGKKVAADYVAKAKECELLS